VFVFLGEGFGASHWQGKWERGDIPGICDRLPYGYFHAGNESWRITYAEDRKESLPLRMLRKGIRKMLGFDIFHAWYNSEQLSGSDVVWTHTEREYLATLCLWRFWAPKTRPKLIAQSIWLFDRWRNFSFVRRWIYRKLIVDADILTALSPDSVREARRLFPQKRCELVKFGIDPAGLKPAHLRQFHQPIRILSLGTDMHRDWDTLIEAVRNWGGGELRVASRTIRKQGLWPDNVTIVRPKTAEALRKLYDWADIVVLALKSNLHASGITVIIEAVLLGLPVISTDTGGLRAYFSEREIRYVAPYSSQAIRNNIDKLASDSDLRFELTFRAQQRILRDNLTSAAYAIQHRNLSKSLLHTSTDCKGERTG
jgi:glycosyltransferase involved in cell wall biosynthesis